MDKNYYDILGITEEEKNLPKEEFNDILRKKWRSLALSLHPDRQQGKSEEEKKRAEEKFKEAAEAYEVLSDEQKRSEYDNPASGFQFSGFGSDADFHEFVRRHFGDIAGMHGFGSMGFDDFGGMGFGGQQQASRKGSGIRIKVGLTLEEMYSGTKKKLKYPRYERCSTCNGSGRTSESREKTCPTCGGKGMVYSHNQFMQMYQTCPTCGGKGHFVENPCKECGGFGIVQKEHEVEITFDKGLMHGMELVYGGLGSAPPHGDGVNGDLYVIVYEKKDDRFERNGADLYMKIDVPVIDAILGGQIKVDTIGGKTLTSTLKQGTEDGTKLLFKGYGMPIYGTNNYGNLICVVHVTMPKSLNKEEKKLLSDLKKKEHFK